MLQTHEANALRELFVDAIGKTIYFLDAEGQSDEVGEARRKDYQAGLNAFTTKLTSLVIGTMPKGERLSDAALEELRQKYITPTSGIRIIAELIERRALDGVVRDLVAAMDNRNTEKAVQCVKTLQEFLE